GDDAPALRHRTGERRGGALVDLVPFFLDAVVLDTIDADRLKGTVADVQRDRRELDAACAQRRQALVRQVKTGRRRRNRAARRREQGLIPFAILRAIGSLDIGRQWHVTERVDRFVDR